MSGNTSDGQIVLGCAFLAGLALCWAGCSGHARQQGSVSDLDGVQSTASRFLRALEAGLPDKAHDVATDAFQARMNRESLAKFIDDNPALRRRHRLLGLSMSPSDSGTQCRYVFVVQGNGNASEQFELVIVQEGALWKVNELNKLQW